MGALQLTLLGGFQARRPGGVPVTVARRKAQALLAYLALHPDRSHPREKLAALLWGEAPGERARHSLRQALLTLRQALSGDAAHCVVEEGDGVSIDGSLVEVDVVSFERLAAEATPEALERASALYGGDLLSGIAFDETLFEEWLRTERERLRELAIEVLARLLAHQERAGQVDRAVVSGVRLLGLDSTQEPVHRTLMRLYARQGRRGAALRQYQICVDVLERELGTAPEPETRRLYHELLVRPSGAPHAAPGPSASGGDVETAPIEPSTLGVPMVGRESEIATLRRTLEEVERGQGRVVQIAGEAGIGKTRLVEALIVETLAVGGRVLVGRAHENEQVLPLGPWVDAFRTGQAVATLDGLDAPWRGELARFFPELGSPRQDQPAAEEYVRLFEAMTRAVEHLTLARPLLLVLEDLQWADEMTLRLLVFLARRIATWRLLLAGTFREEEMVDATLLRRSLGQLGRMSGSVSLTLAPLSRSDTVALIRALTRTESGDAVIERLGEPIWQASEGNPFMVTEMVRALPPGGEPRPGEAPGLPRTVRELILARLDRVGDAARRLVAVASVIGRECEFALLQRAAGASEADAAEAIGELVGRRILRAVGERLDFSHERIREVAYETLLPPYRTSLHGAVARSLEALYGPDLAPHALAIGRHFHAGEVWDRACHYLAQAAAWAAMRGAHREAIASYELALVALRAVPASRERDEQAIDLRFELRHSCVPLGDHARILEHLREAEAAAGAIGDLRRLGWTLAYQTHGLYLAGMFADAIDSGERALAIAAELDDARLEEWANVYVAQVYHWAGRYRDGLARLRHNVTVLEPRLAQRGLPPQQVVNTRMFAAWCLAELGEFAEARARAAEGIAAARESDSAYWLVHAHSGAALADLRREALDEAGAGAERALELCGGRDYFVLWAIPATILGGARAAAGRAAEAIALLERAAEIGGVLVAPVLVFLGQAYLAGDRAADAQVAAQRALALAVDHGERGWEAWSRWLLAESGARGDTPEAACDVYRAALSLADELSMRPLVAHCHRGLGRLYRDLGKTALADEHRTMAASLYRQLEMPAPPDAAP
jgi:DNA-binding SARP family transcriptional activator/tetratricopeptide (TPR) repeat protein